MATPTRRRALQTSARATLLWASLGFLLLQGVFRVVIDRVRPEWRDPSFEIKAARLARILAQHSERPITVLMTGSSVTSNAFKAKQIEEQLTIDLHRPTVAFNMGNHGGGPLTQLIWLRRLLERGVRPDFVCVEFSPQLFDQPDVPEDAKRFPTHILTREDIRTIEPYVHDPEMRREWRLYRWFPTYFHRLTILNCTINPIVPLTDRIPTWGGTIDERCWTALPPCSKQELESNVAFTTAHYAAKLEKLATGKTSVQALEQLLALLKRERIHAAVVMVPQSPSIRRLYPAAKLDAFVERVAKLSAENHAQFVKAFDWLDEEQFNDCLHPVSAGAERFSTRLRQEVLLPALQRGR